MTPKLATIVVNARDLERIVTFWSAFLQVGEQQRTPGFVRLEPQPGARVSLAVQQVDDPTPGRNCLHLDFGTDDAAATGERVIDLGGTELESHEVQDFGWTVYADPEGNEFCIAQFDPDDA